MEFAIRRYIKENAKPAMAFIKEFADDRIRMYGSLLFTSLVMFWTFLSPAPHEDKQRSWLAHSIFASSRFLRETCRWATVTKPSVRTAEHFRPDDQVAYSVFAFPPPRKRRKSLDTRRSFP